MFNQSFVVEGFGHVHAENEFAVMRHEFLHHMHAFAEEAAFAFATLFGREGKHTLEPRRVEVGIFASLDFGHAGFECGFVQYFFDFFLLFFGALAVNRSTCRSKFAARATVAEALVTERAATFAASEGATVITVATRAAFTVEATFAAVTKLLVAKLAVSTVAPAIVERTAFAATAFFTVVVTARTTFRLFAHSELTVQSHLYGAVFIFFAHTFSMICLATDSPSIFKSLNKAGISPCSTK